MALPALAVAAKTLLKTPAGQIAIRKGSKAVARFLKRNKPTRTSVLLAGSGAAELSNEEGPIDMKANAAKEEEQRAAAAAAKEKRQEITRKTAALLNKGGLIKSRIDGIATKGKTRAKHR